MPYIIGTAGHIDHGKTSLIKALTGEDTDRLKEEKERGISIDLGFAHLDLPDGTRAGVVDVPGHERFIRNMLAGAHGIDLVLFTVAADDGVMPQTEEHFDIVHLLGVERAIFVVTKVDLVPEARRAEVADEIRMLTAGTPLARSPIVPFSFVTGLGLDQLRLEIAQALRTIDKPAPPGYFRLPVDRVFVLQGHGLVVTGTALAGEVHIGDRVRCLPGDQLFRVRSVQVHDEPVSRATWGQRVALNLSGHDKPSITRGDVICHEQLTSTSDRFDASLDVRASGATRSAVKNHQRVRVHLGTAERLAKLILLGGRDRVEPKQKAFCQLALSEPILTLRGDRFVIRDETARRTLGGGVVLHPWPRIHERREPGLDDTLNTLQEGQLAALIELFVNDHDDFAVSIAPLSQFVNRAQEDVLAALRGANGIRAISLDGERVYTTRTKWDAVKQSLLTSLRAFHASHPLAPGRDMEELRDKLRMHIPPKVFRAVVSQLESETALVREGSVLRLPGHTVELREDERQVAERIKGLLGEHPLTPPDLQHLEASLGIDRGRLLDVMRVLERVGAIVRVSGDLFFLTDSLAVMRSTLHDVWANGEALTPAAFRDRFGTTRKYAIPLLEYLDREGVTVRTGEIRRLKAARS